MIPPIHHLALLRRGRGSTPVLDTIRLVVVLSLLLFIGYVSYQDYSFRRDCGDGFDIPKFNSPACQRWYK